MDQSPSDDPERLLAEARLARGDRLGSLLEHYRNYLSLLARTQVDLSFPGRLNPSDLVQETFVRAIEHFDQFRGQTEREFLAWLRRILVSSLAHQVERNVLAGKRDVRREVSLEAHSATWHESAAALGSALASSVSSPSAQAQQRELVAQVADWLAQLPADYRDVIVLRNFEHLPFEEVARRMDRSPGAVRMLWLRALERLQQLATEDPIS